ncbi:MAG: glycerophosphodiester phosphodiesterase family protein [Planctomycetota bacterium]
MNPLSAKLIGHRGYPLVFPENTLEGIRGALQAGAILVEFDVQLSRDGVPIVYHDATLARTSGQPGSVLDLPAAELVRTGAGEPARFGAEFADVRIPTLEQVSALLAQHPACTAFVEIKEESIERFGASAVVDATVRAIESIRKQAVLISFDREILPACRAHGLPIGWVVRAYDEPTRERLTALAPEFVFANVKRIPPDPVEPWAGAWQWAVYDVVDPAQVLAWLRRGVHLVETWAIGEVLAATDPPRGRASAGQSAK